jgi:signal transduction histidine kinase
LSLRTRLTWAFATAMAVVLAGLGTFIYLRLGGELMFGIDRNLGTRVDALTAALATDRSAPLGGGQRFADPDEAFAQVLDRSGRILDSTPAVTGAPLLSPGQVAAITKPTFVTRSMGAANDPGRLLAVPTHVQGRPGIVVVGETLGDRRDALRQLLELYAVAGPAGVALASAAGWILAGAALRPVERLRLRAAQITESDPQARLPVPHTGDELTRLATTLNDLLARLQHARDREHRFVDDASHELRTPLAILKAELDLALSRPRSPSELEATLRAAAFETDELAHLAEDMLVLARVRDGRLPLRPVAVHLPTFLDQVVAPLRLRLGEPGTPSQIRVNAPDQSVQLDPDRIRQAVQNLVDNALRHGRGPVTITATPRSGRLLIDVQDAGPGFPPTILSSAFDPFTRGPALPQHRDHDRSAGGAGLGLSIVKAIAESHDGTATATNASDGGARVHLDLKT